LYLISADGVEGVQVNLFGPEEAPDMLIHERLALRQGFANIAGIDEAGRGPLAGPVVAAAVILPLGEDIPGVTDSKKLSAGQREVLFAVVQQRAVAVGVGIADAALIDRINILQATLDAMKQAVAGLAIAPDYLLIDGITPVPMNIAQKTLKKGDSLSLSIAAASIVAKVTRDRLMVEMDKEYPGYGFAGHKGYGSAAHMAAIAQLGPCAIHRKTFRGVREFVRDGQ
jgi:ribonuclease HII